MAKIFIFLFFQFIVFSINNKVKEPSVTRSREVCVSQEEKNLYEFIMEYRKDNKQKKISFSKKLTEVAKLHAKDLNDNHSFEDQNCNMHSWSSNGKWKECCYTSDHSDPNCMWDKPKEINGYPGQGYEISYYYSSGVTAQNALEGWQNSNAHNEVLINKGIWKQAEWKAIGIGIHESYATVWFGMVEDELPEFCD